MSMPVIPLKPPDFQAFSLRESIRAWHDELVEASNRMFLNKETVDEDAEKARVSWVCSCGFSRSGVCFGLFCQQVRTSRSCY